jgi:hypothetical protein
MVVPPPANTQQETCASTWPQKNKCKQVFTNETIPNYLLESMPSPTGSTCMMVDPELSIQTHLFDNQYVLTTGVQSLEYCQHRRAISGMWKSVETELVSKIFTQMLSFTARQGKKAVAILKTALALKLPLFQTVLALQNISLTPIRPGGRHAPQAACAATHHHYSRVMFVPAIGLRDWT